MITREEAAYVLRKTIDSGILKQELVCDLSEIIDCIEFEYDSLHVWGVPDEDIQKLLKADTNKAVADKLRFTPSAFEKEAGE